MFKLDKFSWLLILVSTTLIVVCFIVIVLFQLNWYWALLFYLPVFLALNHVSQKQLRQKIEKHFAGRPILNPTEFAQHYFPPDRVVIAAKLRAILTRHVSSDLTRMNPQDRFIEDLLMDDHDSMATVDFIIAIEKEFNIEIPNAAAEKMQTFQDVVNYVAEAVNPHSA